MSNDAGQNENQFRTLAFVSSSEAEQKKQKSEIYEYCQREGLVQPADNEFFSDWQTLKKELQEKRYKAIVFINLRVLSTDVKEVAQKLYELIYEYKIFVCSMNEEQDAKVLSKRRQKHPPISKERILAQLEIDLRDVF